jgi:hypothetical protein
MALARLYNKAVAESVVAPAAALHTPAATELSITNLKLDTRRFE